MRSLFMLSGKHFHDCHPRYQTMKHILTTVALLIVCIVAHSQTIPIGCTEKPLHTNETIRPTARLEGVHAIPDTAKLIRIPIVFNVVHLGEPVGEGTNVSDEYLLDALAFVNHYYKNFHPYLIDSVVNNENNTIDTKVEFFLADVDSNCRYSKGIRRIDGSHLPRYKEVGITWSTTPDGFNNEMAVKNATVHHAKRFLNFWVVSDIYSPGNFIQGFAYIPENYVSGGNQWGLVQKYDNLRRFIKHEMGHVLGLEHNDMYLYNNNPVHAFQIIRKSANYYNSELLGSPIHCSSVLDNELGLVGQKGLTPARCKGAFSPQIKIKNFGSNTIHSVKMKVTNGQQELQDYAWTGTLLTNDTTWIALQPLSLSEGMHELRLFSYEVNGRTDSEKSNDTIKTPLKIVGFLPELPWSTDFESGESPLGISFSENSKAGLLPGSGFAGSKGLLVEGKEKPFPPESIFPGSYDVLRPFGNLNSQFFTYTDFCIHSGANKHYKINYKKYQKGAYSFMRTLANGVPIADYSSGDSDWTTDSVVASSGTSTELLFSFQSSCRSENTKGTYVILDDIAVSEIPLSPFRMDFVSAGVTTGCPPYFNARVINRSSGAPMPTNYYFCLLKEGVVLDTISARNAGDYQPRVREAGIYDLKVIAFFSGGATQDFTIKEYINSTPHLIGPEEVAIETFENGNAFRTYNYSVARLLDWKFANVGAFGKSSRSLMVDASLLKNDSESQVVSLEKGPFYLRDVVGASAIAFDWAYGTTSSTAKQSDYLSVSYSTNCGITWRECFRKDGEYLLTFDVKTAKVPQSDQWATEYVLTETLTGLKDVLLRFNFHANAGSSFYIDNIAFGATKMLNLENGIQAPNVEYAVFPNPSADQITFLSSTPVRLVTIRNASGYVMLNTESAQIDISSLQPGIYFLQASLENGTSKSLKFVKSTE